MRACTTLVWGLISTAALADKPAALQLCLSLPAGVALTSDKPQPNYKAIGPDSYVLDLDVLVNGRQPERLSKDGPRCLRAWLSAVHVHEVQLAFTRTTLNLPTVTKRLDVQLKPDLWSAGGDVAVPRAPWVKVSTSLPGALHLERLDGVSPLAITDLEHVPAGTYRLGYQPPAAARGECNVALQVTASGTIREDNRPARFAELVAEYRKDWLPEVLAANKLTCSEEETLEVALRINDGAFLNPRTPTIRRVDVPSKAPRYALRVGDEALRFAPGRTYTFAAGATVTFELASGDTLAQSR